MGKLKRFGTLATGVVIGIVFSIGVTAFAAGKIKSAEYNGNKVLFDGKEINLTAPLISIIDEATPQNSANYMPVRAILEVMGYTVSLDMANNAINIVSPAVESVVAPAVEPIASIPFAKITLNGAEITVPGATGGTPEYVMDYELVMESLKWMNCEVDWDINSATIVAKTIVAGIEEPLALRDLLSKLEEQGISYETMFNETKREIYLTKGSLAATIIMPLDGSTTAKVVCGKNETEITLIISGGSTFVNEKEVLAALKKVGFIK